MEPKDDDISATESEISGINCGEIICDSDKQLLNLMAEIIVKIIVEEEE